MLLSGTTETDARRLTEFALGLVSASGGTLEGFGSERLRLSSPPEPGSSGDREPREPKPAPRTDAASAPVTADG
jgi:hypothetical protein